ncbi:MAG: hypothetical protein EOO44_18100 [Flavobacterium sp.]|nr:MAG: hypothetical protein EOO44_18100 [Flavobacterium sp.]
MKSIYTLLLAMLFLVGLSNCAVNHTHSSSASTSKKMPPGQAKKVSGSKSAKRYAPGQNK